MKHPHHTNNSAHLEALLLLPWYVNKTLHNDEYNLVETHLKDCLICRIELTNLQKLAASISQEDVIDTVAHVSFLQLKNRINKVGIPPKPKTAILDAVADYYNILINKKFVNVLTQHPVLALATAFFFVFSLFTPDYSARRPRLGNEEFHTLSSTKNIATRNNEIRVVFADDITPQQINQILAFIQGKIVTGPTPQGVFNVQIGESKKADITKAIALLRKNSQVIFAEPAFAVLSSDKQDPG
jgi:hypothetical protein